LAAKKVCPFVGQIAKANFKSRADKCKEQENNYKKIEIKRIICLFYFSIVLRLIFNVLSFIFNHENIMG